ncbi:filament-like plant protein 1 isoform X1 [Lactuca sativa]|nr:filament-like plant protein 1 isoform X1 [Lactuca sativa]
MLPFNTLFYNPKQVSIALISNFITSDQNMDQKTSLHRKRLVVVNNEAEIFVKGNEEEENLLYDKKSALEETVKNLHEQVACLVCECNAKDELMAEHLKTAQEAIAGREKAEAEVAKWKQELEDTLQHNVAAYERLVHLNASLKNCKEQLSCIKLEQDQRVILERALKRLESKYTETRKKLADLTLENALLNKALVKKEEIIKDVSHHISEATSEYLVLKKDLKMRTLNADVAKQETASLEAERQRLRLLVKKRGPGHGKTKQVDKSLSLMIKKLSEVEEENRILKESVCERENEIRILKGEVGRNPEGKILELENKIVSLEMEVERVNELKRRNEEQFENVKLMNVDLDHQLSDAKFKLKEALRRVFVLEMELEDRNQQYEGLETALLELQLQLASVSINKEIKEDLEQEMKLLHTGSEITRELSQHSSLRDHMAAEDGFQREDVLRSPMIKDFISATETKDAYVPYCNTYSSSFGVKSVVPQALLVVPWKKQFKGTELLRKLLFRKKRGGNRKKLCAFATYHV